jgi:trans-2,3-dihydro-3-hydroxyanthranilate isomerase
VTAIRRYPFATFDVFTDRRFGGNPLAVFPDARGLSDAEMQALAAEMNLSETTFVLPPEDAANDARVRIFTRVAEMPFAGHPNVGTGFALAPRARGGVLRFEQMAGLVEVRVLTDAAGEPVGAEVDAPQPLALGATPPPALLAAAAALPVEAIVTARHAPILAQDGARPRALVEVRPEALAAAAPDAAAFRRAVAECAELDGWLSLYLYCQDGPGRLRARMFSPLGGTPEDAATGSAATTLAGFLLHLSGAESARLDIAQGVEMGRPSLLRARARRTPGGIRASVGGGCVPVLRGEALL